MSTAAAWRSPTDGNHRFRWVYFHVNSSHVTDEIHSVDRYPTGFAAKTPLSFGSPRSNKPKRSLTSLSARSRTSRKLNRSGKPARVSNWLHDRFNCCRYWSESRFSICRIWLDLCKDTQGAFVDEETLVLPDSDISAVNPPILRFDWCDYEPDSNARGDSNSSSLPFGIFDCLKEGNGIDRENVCSEDDEWYSLSRISFCK